MKIKRIITIFVLVFILTGCTNINDMTYDDMLNILQSDAKRPNKSRTGFKYYLPNGMNVTNRGTYYEIIKSERTYYYLYVDMISYINKVENKYEEKSDAYYSQIINVGDKYGYIEINSKENNQYLIEIMYNYAKIEVMVDSSSINEAIIYSVNILNSIEYNINVINNLLNNDTLNYTEEEFNLFETGVDSSNTLEYIETDYSDEVEEEEIKDTDYIN